MKIAVACDHAGFAYKQEISRFLMEKGCDVQDFGTNSECPVDYPVVIRLAAEAVASGDFDGGIVLGGSGNGEAIAANKVHGIRCAVCWHQESARLAKAHNHANMIAIGQRLVALDLAFVIVDTWLNTAFEGGRHIKRINELEGPVASTGDIQGA